MQTAAEPCCCALTGMLWYPRVMLQSPRCREASYGNIIKAFDNSL